MRSLTGRTALAGASASSLALALGIWVISPRFSIPDLSLIDDWWSATYSGEIARALVHLD